MKEENLKKNVKRKGSKLTSKCLIIIIQEKCEIKKNERIEIIKWNRIAWGFVNSRKLNCTISFPPTQIIVRPEQFPFLWRLSVRQNSKKYNLNIWETKTRPVHDQSFLRISDLAYRYQHSFVFTTMYKLFHSDKIRNLRFFWLGP